MTTTAQETWQEILSQFGVRAETQAGAEQRNRAMAFLANWPYYLTETCLAASLIGIMVGAVIAIIAVIGHFAGWSWTPNVALWACFIFAPGTILLVAYRICEAYEIGEKRFWGDCDPKPDDVPQKLEGLFRTLGRTIYTPRFKHLTNTRQYCAYIDIPPGSTDVDWQRVYIARWRWTN